VFGLIRNLTFTHFYIASEIENLKITVFQDEIRCSIFMCYHSTASIFTEEHLKGDRREPDVFEMDSTKQLGVVGSGTRYYSPR
jgi:hypothetical protein